MAKAKKLERKKLDKRTKARLQGRIETVHIQAMPRQPEKPEPAAEAKAYMPYQAYAKKHAYSGPPIDIIISGRWFLALQVRNKRDPQWGNVKAFNIHPNATPEHVKAEYAASLRREQMGWILDGYFGGTAEWRIEEVQGPPLRITCH